MRASTDAGATAPEWLCASIAWRARAISAGMRPSASITGPAAVADIIAACARFG